jgi:HD-GYP domain-containing protein (c-di-GMP phosphodiesterase class II)
MQQFCPLSAVKQRITLGAPLPFNVRDADRTLLLASGQVIDSREQMEALFSRGALVDVEELRHPAAEVTEAPPEALPALWDKSLDRVSRVLKSATPRGFATALDDAARPALALIERDPDLAIFQIVRQQSGRRAQYGVAHSLHTAIASHIAATRLGWDKALAQRLFKAGLTMNLSILELQGRLALQVAPLTPAQREAIHAHPLRSAEMLQQAGITDPEWLEAVAHHHAATGDDGYPEHVGEVGEFAHMLHRADVYTAKLSPRATRDALAANVAARAMVLADQHHPMTAALVKEFGVYPPGCCVRLHSGELGVVIKRGETATTPIAAALTNRHGEPLLEPVRRDTAEPDHAIVAVISEKSLPVRLNPEQLVLRR